MAELNTLSIQELYREVNHISKHGIEGYHVDNKYCDPLQMMKSREFASGRKPMKKHETKRGNYLDDEANLHKIIPGPGKYNFKDEWPKKCKSLHTETNKTTYIDELMKREKKEKKPGPGQYQIIKTLKQIEAEKKLMQQRKVKQSDRISYLDHVQFEATQTPGTGAYNPHDRIKTEGSKIKTKPEDWRKKHGELSKKKPPKLPDMGTYNPEPVDIGLFSNLKKSTTNKNLQGKVDRFKRPHHGSGLPPGKYVILQDWHGKEDKKRQRHGLESISKGISKSVYYH